MAMDPALASISAAVPSQTYNSNGKQHRLTLASRTCSNSLQFESTPNFASSQQHSDLYNSSCAIIYCNYHDKINVCRPLKPTKPTRRQSKSTSIPVLFSILFTLYIFIPAINTDESIQKLPLCERHQACAAEISHFPLLSETVGEMREVTEVDESIDGSGQSYEGSGMGSRMPHIPADDFPLYDEFVTSQPVFDYNTDAELSRADICRCPDRDEVSGEETSACEFAATDGDNVMRVDKSIRLAFCRPIIELLRMKCVGRRALVRIIGSVDLKTGEALTNVNDTAVFCRCESPLEFRRTAIEPWQDKYAFVYRYVWYRRREPSVSPDGITTPSVPTPYLLSSAVEIVTRQRVAEQLESLLRNIELGRENADNENTAPANNQERFFHSSPAQPGRQSFEEAQRRPEDLTLFSHQDNREARFSFLQANQYNNNLQFSSLCDLFAFLLEANEIRLKENIEAFTMPTLNTMSDDEAASSSADDNEMYKHSVFHSPLDLAEDVNQMNGPRLQEVFTCQQSLSNLLMDTRTRAFGGGYCDKCNSTNLVDILSKLPQRVLRKRSISYGSNESSLRRTVSSDEKLRNFYEILRKSARRGPSFQSEAHKFLSCVGQLGHQANLVHLLRNRECGVGVTNVKRRTCVGCRKRENGRRAIAAITEASRTRSGATIRSSTQSPSSDADKVLFYEDDTLLCGKRRAYPGGFTSAEKVMLNNDFLPNQMRIVDCIESKTFCVSYLSNGREFITASQDHRIRHYVASGTHQRYSLRKTLMVPYVGWSIIDTAISPDGRHLLYSTWNEPIYLYDFTQPENGWKPLHIDVSASRYAFFSLRFSTDGREVVAGASDNHIYIYDREAAECVLGLEAHEDDVNAVCFGDAAGHLILSAGDDGLCKVWDRRTMGDLFGNHPIGIFAGHRDGISFIDSRGDDRYILTNSKDQTIKLWDMRIFASEKAVQATRTAISHQDWDYRFNAPYIQSLRPLEGDCSIATLNGHSVLHTLVRSYFSPDHTGKRYVYTGCASGKCLVYDLLTGETAKIYTGHSSVVRDCAWNPHRNEILTSSWDGHTYLWRYDQRRSSSSPIVHSQKGKIEFDSEESCDENYQQIRRRRVAPSQAARFRRPGRNRDRDNRQ